MPINRWARADNRYGARLPDFRSSRHTDYLLRLVAEEGSCRPNRWRGASSTTTRVTSASATASDLHRFGQHEPSLGDEPEQIIGMVHDFDLKSEVRVLVLQRVETVRARRDHGARASLLLVAVDRRGVSPRRASRRETRCRARRAGSPVQLSSCAQDLRSRLRPASRKAWPSRARSFCSIVVARGAAHPEQDRRRGLCRSSSGHRGRRPIPDRSMRDRFHGLPFVSMP